MAQSLRASVLSFLDFAGVRVQVLELVKVVDDVTTGQNGLELLSRSDRGTMQLFVLQPFLELL